MIEHGVAGLMAVPPAPVVQQMTDRDSPEARVDLPARSHEWPLLQVFKGPGFPGQLVFGVLQQRADPDAGDHFRATGDAKMRDVLTRRTLCAIERAVTTDRD